MPTREPAGPVTEPSYLEVTHGLRSWLLTLDHKRIGLMYLFGILIALIIGGTFALLLRTELWDTGKTIVGQDVYNQFFTLHGAVMVFLVIIPGIPAALGNIMMPIQLGAPDVAFPRLNLSSFYLWVTGALMLILTIPFGGLDTGWTLYTPYSLESQTAVLMATFGVFILGFSSIFTGLNFLVTIHKFRPQGMGWFQMPLNVWAIYATAIMQVLATPVLGITTLLLSVERFGHIGIFDPNMGGDPVLFQHFFWFYSHPAVYIMIIPAMGVISELITTFARKPLFGYRFVAYSSVSLALLSFLVWGHHMFVSGQSRLANMVFSALTFTVGIPSAIKVFNWVATLYKGDIRLKVPMLYALSFLLLFTIGGLTGLFLAILSVDVHLHDTYFVVAHFHYVMMGSTLVAFMGALHFWWPKFTGRWYPESLGRVCTLGVFFGFNLTFLPQFVMGARGMPRRYWDYDPQYRIFHQLSTIGAYVLGLSLFTTVVYLFWSFKNGKKAPRNPWGGSTLEWQCPTPPPLYNFETPPILHELYNYDDIVEVEPDVWERRLPEQAHEVESAVAVVKDARAEAAGISDARDPLPATEQSLPAIVRPSVDVNAPVTREEIKAVIAAVSSPERAESPTPAAPPTITGDAPTAVAAAATVASPAPATTTEAAAEPAAADAAEKPKADEEPK